MSLILPSLLTAFASLAGFTVLIQWSRWRVADLRAASERMDEVYASAQLLVKNKETPERVLKFVYFFSSKAGSPFLARKFAGHLVTGAFQKAPDTAESRKFMSDLQALDKEQKEIFVKFVVSGMVASAASDPLFSRVYLFAVRSFLSASGRADGQPSTERAQAVALDLGSKVPGKDLAFA